ncbi:hypothetical protein LTR93_003066 [Exophiala xenobiotica]|nr:hypothetical protein LTR93_003066 [Exophiala xenobiotica]
MTDTDSYAANGQGLSINGYDASLDVSDATNYLANGHDTNGDTKQRDNVIVVGAGPVGLLIALRLAKAGIPTTILEMLPYVEQSPRAAVYHAISVRELDRAGVLEDCRANGKSSSDVSWRKLNGEVIASIDRKPLPGEKYQVLVLGQHELAEIILKHVRQCKQSQVLFNHKAVEIQQDDKGVRVAAETPDGIKQFSARYLVGADGGRSGVRRLIDVPFEGFTWPQSLVACNVVYPFDKYGYNSGNFIVDKDHWCLIASLNEPGLWRVSYGELPGLTHEQLMERQPMKFEAIFPGPRPLKYELKNASPYRINQRCATTMKKGNVLLAGDAAHLCNPYGGLGLTGGMLDAGACADALIATLKQGYPESVLESYAEKRKKVWHDIIDPTSQANVKRIFENDPDTVGQTDPFLKMLNDPTIDKAKLRAGDGLYVDVLVDHTPNLKADKPIVVPMPGN